MSAVGRKYLRSRSRRQNERGPRPAGSQLTVGCAHTRELRRVHGEHESCTSGAFCMFGGEGGLPELISSLAGQRRSRGQRAGRHFKYSVETRRAARLGRLARTCRPCRHPIQRRARRGVALPKTRVPADHLLLLLPRASSTEPGLRGYLAVPTGESGTFLARRPSGCVLRA